MPERPEPHKHSRDLRKGQTRHPGGVLLYFVMLFVALELILGASMGLTAFCSILVIYNILRKAIYRKQLSNSSTARTGG
jgi:hypothetical protein